MRPDRLERVLHVLAAVAMFLAFPECFRGGAEAAEQAPGIQIRLASAVAPGWQGELVAAFPLLEGQAREKGSSVENEDNGAPATGKASPLLPLTSCLTIAPRNLLSAGQGCQEEIAACCTCESIGTTFCGVLGCDPCYR